MRQMLSLAWDVLTQAAFHSTIIDYLTSSWSSGWYDNGLKYSRFCGPILDPVDLLWYMTYKSLLSSLILFARSTKYWTRSTWPSPFSRFVIPAQVWDNLVGYGRRSRPYHMSFQYKHPYCFASVDDSDHLIDLPVSSYLLIPAFRPAWPFCKGNCYFCRCFPLIFDIGQSLMFFTVADSSISSADSAPTKDDWSHFLGNATTFPPFQDSFNLRFQGLKILLAFPLRFISDLRWYCSF